jgi:hypothetical protein
VHLDSFNVLHLLLQDKRDDAKAQVGSTALLFGDRTPQVLNALAAVQVGDVVSRGGGASLQVCVGVL